MPDSTTITLHNGVVIPRVGLGVFRAAEGRETRDAVREALRVGYRHVDTARIYLNETDVGAAIRESGVPRGEVFVTTKLWNRDQGYDATLRAYDASEKRLGLGAVDLYLMHWPVAGKRLDSWRAMERLLAEKRVRAIGVSNFVERHLEELLAKATVVPMINQIEVHPFLPRRTTRDFCAKHGVVVEAYSPLAKAQRMQNDTLVAVANECGRSPAQVLLRWGLQHGMVVLPKSVKPARIAENFALTDFALSDAQMQRLDALDENLATGWNPDDAP